MTAPGPAQPMVKVCEEASYNVADGAYRFSIWRVVWNGQTWLVCLAGAAGVYLGGVPLGAGLAAAAAIGLKAAAHFLALARNPRA